MDIYARANRYPFAVAVDRNNAIVVADGHNHRLRIIGGGGLVTTLAGNSEKGSADGMYADVCGCVWMCVDVCGCMCECLHADVCVPWPKTVKGKHRGYVCADVCRCMWMYVCRFMQMCVRVCM